MVGSRCPASEVTWEYLQNLVRKGYMTVAEFATCLLRDPAYGGLVTQESLLPPLNLWSHFFQAWLWRDSGAGAASMGNVYISLRSGLGANSYISFPQPDPPVGWRKAWFLLKNEADVPLPTFTGRCLVPHPNWEYGVAWTDFPRLQPLLEI
jgi:hypothetical protein